MWNHSAFSGYLNDVAVIGRDDASGLNQKQSRTASPISIVTMGIGAIAVDNQSNSNSFATDLSFLSWANNDGDNNSYGTTGVTGLASISTRLERQWKVNKEGGNVSNLTVQFDLNGNSPPSTEAIDYKLLIDNDGVDFSDATIISADSYISDVVEFSGVNFNNGQFFALGIRAPSFVVTNTDDSGEGSLRQAILDANNSSEETISFNIAGGGPWNIELQSPLPAITSGSKIDATTQTGWIFGNPNAMVIVDGATNSIIGDGLTISSANTEVRGLVITGFTGDGVQINASSNNFVFGSAGSGNVVKGNSLTAMNISSSSGGTIQGNYFGTSIDGLSMDQNLSHGLNVSGSDGLTIGGNSVAGEGNLISGNGNSGTEYGIQIATSDNVNIYGNLIGVDLNGENDLGNNRAINITTNADFINIGGTGTGQSNVISGSNGSFEIVIQGGSNVVVDNNIIGLNSAGDTKIATSGSGIDGIRLTTDGAGMIFRNNTIAGLSGDGIDMTGVQSAVLIQNNQIGTGLDGTGGIDPTEFDIGGRGIQMQSSNGLDNAAQRIQIIDNIISNTIGTGDHGIQFTFSCFNILIQGNKIGVETDGTTALGNGGSGIFIPDQVSNITIGGSMVSEQNIIANSTNTGEVHGSGIYFDDNSSNDGIFGTVDIQQNLIFCNGGGAINYENTGPPIAFPVITSVTTTDIDGTTTAPDGSTVYVYESTDGCNNSQGRTFLGEANVTGGNWNIGGSFTPTNSFTAFVNSTAGLISEFAVRHDLTVTSTADDGAGTLREAMTLANLNTAAGTIDFNIVAGGGPWIIPLASPLPVINNPHDAALTIDGTTQLGWSMDGGLMVTLDGTSLSNFDTFLNLEDPNTEIYGLHITNLPTDATGIRTGSSGTAHNYVIGAPNMGNVIADGGGTALFLINADGGVVQGNRIGTTPDGLTAAANADYGIRLSNANNTTIGGAGADEGNLVSRSTGGQGIGFAISASDMVNVYGNLFGTDRNGENDFGNNRSIVIAAGSNINIGGLTAGQRNVISGANGDAEIDIEGTSNSIIIQNNLIGLNSAGTTAIDADGAFSTAGVLLNTTNSNTGIEILDNTIAGMKGNGISLVQPIPTSDVKIRRNNIGTNASGVQGVDLGNEGLGIRVLCKGADNTTGRIEITDNIISGNGTTTSHRGIALESGTNILIQNNLIGVETDGTTAYGNAGHGIAFNSLVTNVEVASNTIAYSSLDGIFFDNLSATASGVIISPNSYFCNTNDAINFGNAPTVNVPVITTISASSIAGTTTAANGSTVHLYEIDPSCADNQGAVLTATRPVSGGNWSYFNTIDVTKTYVATVTDPTNGISEFGLSAMLATAPADLVAYTSSSTEITFEWTDSPDETSYILERADNFAFTMGVTTIDGAIPAGTTSYMFNAGIDQSYFYRLSAVNGLGAGAAGIEFGTTQSFPGFALDFNGVNQHLSATSPTDLPLGNSAFTIEAWVRPDNQKLDDGITSWGTLGLNARYNGFMLTAGETFAYGLKHTFHNNVLELQTPDLSGEWHHVAVSYDGTTRTLYLDGIPLGSDVPGAQDVRLSAIGIAAANLGSFDGQMDEVKIWDIAISDFSNRFSPLIGNEAGLIAYYPLDENGGTTAVDRSTNSNSANLANSPASAASTMLTLLVTNTSNAGAGSLDQAILDANSAGGVPTITFNIPIGGGGPWTIQPTSELSDITRSMIIDGSTQPTWNINANLMVVLDGQFLGGGTGLTTLAPGLEVYGLKITGFPTNGIEFQGSGSGGAIGDESRGNVINDNGNMGIRISNTTDVVIRGNRIGTDYLGTSALGNAFGINLNSGGSTIVGGSLAGQGNLISGNTVVGISGGASSNHLEGNIIGLNISHSAVISNGFGGGISLSGSDGNTLVNNIVSGNGANGIELAGSNQIIIGNTIGTDLTGNTDFGNSGDGIRILSGDYDNWQIGTGNPGEGNVIAFNGGNAVQFNNATQTGHLVSENSIYENAGGIFIAAANNGITAPNITNVTASNVSVDGVANGDLIEVFIGDGNGQGEIFIGSAVASGSTLTVGSLSQAISLGDEIVTTRIDGSNNTSEFSTPLLNYPSVPGSGSTLTFNGSSDNVENTSPTGLPVGSAQRTVEVWFKATKDLIASPESALVQWGTALNGQMFGLITSSNAPGKLYFFGNGADLAGTTDLIQDQWYHAAVKYDGVNVTLYLNGVEEATAPVALNTVIDANGLSIGERPGNSFWQGDIDEVRIWDVSLSQTTIRDWATRKLDNTHVNYGDLVSYYRFDEGAGSALGDLAGSNEGTITGGVWNNSGAHLGDESAHTTTTSVALGGGATSGNNLTVNNIQGSPDITYLYRVNEAPNDVTVDPELSTLNPTDYYGVFQSGGTNPTFNAQWFYTNNTGVNGQPGENGIRFMKRENNADGVFDEFSSSILDVNTTSNIVIDRNIRSGEFAQGYAAEYPTPTPPGNALTFDGVDDYIDLGTDLESVFAGADKQFTIEAWVNPNAFEGTGREIILSKQGNSNCGVDERQITFSIFEVEGLTFTYYGANDISLVRQYHAGNVPANTWSHVAVTYDGSIDTGDGIDRVQFYINGVLQTKTVGGSAGAFPFDLVSGPAHVGIGANLDASGALCTNPDNIFTGPMDEIRIWDTALDNATILDHVSSVVDDTHPNYENLVSYHRFDDSDGTVSVPITADLAGNNNGVLSGFPGDNSGNWSVSGALNGTVLPNISLDFDGVNDVVVIPDAPSIDFGDDDFTAEMWINTTTSDVPSRIITKHTCGSANGWFLFMSSNGVFQFFVAGSVLGSNTIINDGIWHHIAVTFSTATNTQSIYVDGVLDATQTGVNGVANNAPLSIGAFADGACGGPGSEPTEMRMDEVRIWNTTRTPTNIQDNLYADLAGNEPGLVAYYNFDQGVPEGNNAGETTLFDQTANGNDGTLPNHALSGTSSNWVFSEFETPFSPSNLFTTEVSDTQIDLSWSDNAFNEGSYTIERSDGNNFFFCDSKRSGD